MPEGHTIHHAARQQWRRLGGQELAVSSPQGRFHNGATDLDGGAIVAVEAHGKHLFYHWDTNHTVHVHLGLYGRFRWHKSPPPEPRGAVRMRMVGEKNTLDLHGPTACEMLTKNGHEAILARLGPDPLRKDADAEAAWLRIQKSRAAIGKLLLDQSVIAGIGNVYRAELLFALRMHPEQSGNTISRDHFNRLWKTICDWMKIGAKYNRIITTGESSGRPLARLNRRERLAIYKKEYCSNCERPVENWTLAARTIYACHACQPLRE